MTKRSHVTTTINGEAVDFLCEPRQSLLEVLRDVLYLTGTKEGCNDGNCGACSVIMDGVLVDSCCVLGVEAEGSEIETIEGLARNGELHPLQKAFLEQTGMQCGICTPGFLMAAKALLDFSFNELGLNRIQARHMMRNPGSGRVLQKIGMRPEGIHRQHIVAHGKTEDVAMYAILREEWQGGA